MQWRYQMMYTKQDKETDEYFMCEVYLDKEGKLEAWTKDKEAIPYGESPEELIYTLKLMLRDAKEWKVVPFNSLAVGMTFKRNNDKDW